MPEEHEMKRAGGQCGAFAKRGRFWAVTDAAGRLVCLAVYKKGAQEVLRRLDATTMTDKRRRAKPRRRQHEIQSQESQRQKRQRGE